MTHTDQTPNEVMESMTGFDEIAVAQKFGGEILSLAESRQTAFMRALVFVIKRREGLKDADAYRAAQELTLKETQEFFALDDEVMPDEPVTPAGKDEPQPANAQ